MLVTPKTAPEFGIARRGTRPRWPLSWHAGLLAVILGTVALLYCNVTQAYYCANDDWRVLHRAVFEDAKQPSHIFTTSDSLEARTINTSDPNLGSRSAYRPFSRGLDLVTYKIAGKNAIAFRVRGVLFHLVNIFLLYVLALLLDIPVIPAAAAALLFGIHPLANQAIVGATWTVTAAYSDCLATLVLFLLYVRRQRRILGALFVVAAAAGLFFSETQIVFFAALLVYVLLSRSSLDAKLQKRALLVLAVAVVFSVCLYAGCRLAFVPAAYVHVAAVIPTPTKMVTAALMMGAAVLCPIDPVLANSLGFPLPSEEQFRTVLPVFGIAILLVLCALAVLMWKTVGVRRSQPASLWSRELFLAVTAVLPVGMIIFFRGHASETYLYPALPLLILLITELVFEAYVSRGRNQARQLYLGGVAVVAILFGWATHVRNERVIECGDIAHRVLSSIPFDRFKTGGKLLFTEVADGVPSRHYGFYGFTGLDTIRSLPSFTLSYALQVASGNEEISDDAPGATKCEACADQFLVHSDGRVTEIRQNSLTSALNRVGPHP